MGLVGLLELQEERWLLLKFSGLWLRLLFGAREVSKSGSDIPQNLRLLEIPRDYHRRSRRDITLRSVTDKIFSLQGTDNLLLPTDVPARWLVAIKQPSKKIVNTPHWHILIEINL